MGTRVGVITLAAALAMGVTVMPAHADQRPCVSRREYRHVGQGWRQSRVANHFDILGTRIIDEGSDRVWKYRKCSAWGPGGWYVGIWYANYYWSDSYMRVAGKVPSKPCTVGDHIFTCD